MTAPGAVEHFFRHEYGKLVAVLVRRVGTAHLDAAEDAVQSALEKALERWTASGPPDDGAAWLYRVAYNELLDTLRKRARHQNALETQASDIIRATIMDDTSEPSITLPDDFADDLLRMLFFCCDPAIPVESQIVLALKILCGFSVPEIAERLFTSDANIYKRFARGRNRLNQGGGTLDLDGPELEERCPAVCKTLYLLFTEGYLSTKANTTIRIELCDEAIRLTTLLAEHPAGDTPETSALLALMFLHRSRMSSRENAMSGLLLLEEQDRSLWDRDQIELGLKWLARSAIGDDFTRYHAEAGVAAEHCLAESYESTRWDRVAENYALLEAVAPSPLHRLNRAVAVAEWHGPEAGLALLDEFEPPAWVAETYYWPAVVADLSRRAGDRPRSDRHRALALERAPTKGIQSLLRRRLSLAAPET